MATEGTSYQGGAGGKFRKKPLKMPQTTPYDRPPTALRNPSWVSKMIVDPASKLVAASAHLFFSSLFRKRLTHPPPPPSPLPPRGANQESTDTFQETVTLVSSPVGDQGPTLNDSGKQGIPEDQGLEMNSGKQMTATDIGGLSELELLLKQKTFTRSEIVRLTELLQSRTVESNGNGERSTEYPRQETISASRGQDNFARSSLQEAKNECHWDNHRFPGHFSTSLASSKVLDADVATPAELAKAYMGNKSSRVSPSVLGLRNQASREDSGVLCNSPFASRSPAMSLVKKPSVHGGVLENGFMTPRSRGRSEIYNMARSSYSRVHPTASHKGNGSIYDDRNGPSASSAGFARELVARSVSKDLAMKRRSSVLEDEIGFVGPIRRLRQKTNLSTPNNTCLSVSRTPFSSRRTGIAPNGTLDPSSSSKTFQGGEDNGHLPGTSYTSVPSQSKETARKILQQLEKLAPKEKQLKDKVGALSENSPSKFMPNMLNAQALRTLEDVDSSRILQGTGYSLNYTQKGLVPDACETSSSERHKNVEENGPKSSSVSHGTSTPTGPGNGTVVFKDTVPAFSYSGSVKKQVVTQSSQKKWGFQMSAHEDILELEDASHSEAAASAKVAERNKKLETSEVDSKAVPVTEDKTSISEFKAPTGSSEFGKLIDVGTSDGTRVVEKSSGFMFSAAPAASMSFPSVVSVSQSTTSTKNIPDKEPNASPPLFSSGTKIDDKISPYTFSSSSFVGGSFGLKSTAPAEVNQETTISLASNASDATETVPKPANSVNGGVDMQKPGETVGRPESLFSLPQSKLASTSSLLAAGSKPNFSSLSNGLLNSTAPSISYSPVPVLPTSNSGNQALSNPFTGSTFSTTNSNAASSEPTPSTSATSSTLLAPAFMFGSTSNSTLSTTITPTPSLPTTPDFKSGSSFVAPSTYSTVSTTSNSTDVKAGAEKETSPPSNPFSAPSFQMGGTGSNIFGFSAGATSSSTAANLPQGSLFGISGGTSVSTQNVSIFGSSTPSSTLGTSGSTLFTTGSSLFGSSTFSGPALGNITSSSISFGNNSTSSSISFGNNSTSSSSLFSSSTSSSSLFDSSTTSKDFSSSPSFGLSTSASSSTGFVFGAQSPALGLTAGDSSSSSLFSFSSTAQSQPMLGCSVVPAFASAPGFNNGDQMTMVEDSMVEDLVQVGPTPSLPVFGQPPVSNPSPGPFVFGSTPPSSSSVVNPFQFSGQQSQPGAQNANPFQPSGSLDFGGGGSFSLGSDDKSSRRIIRVKHKSKRK